MSTELLPVVISDVNRSSFPRLLARLAGYSKSCSILWLSVLGLPILNGLIIDTWNAKTFGVVERFARHLDSDSFLLRIDRKNQRWTSRRGGYAVSVRDIPDVWKDLSLEGFIPIVLEDASPYLNQRALAALFSKEEQTLTVESIGPGFDASDILRSDLSPHERWHIRITKPKGKWAADNFRRSFVISQEGYLKSRNKRLAKIGAKILNPSLPDTTAIERSDEHLRLDAIRYLKSNGETLLLDATTYESLSAETLNQFVNDTLRLASNLEQTQPGIGSMSVAASLISDGRLVFWDFLPVNKQEFRLLWE